VAATGRIAALGEDARIAGFALAGVPTVRAETADAVRRAWAELPADVVLVLLTPTAAAALGDVPRGSAGRLTAVLPT